MAMSYLFKVTFFFGFCALFACRSTSDVVSDSWIQKRKYRPGFFIGGKSASPVLTSETRQMTSMQSISPSDDIAVQSLAGLEGEIKPVVCSSNDLPEMIPFPVPGHPQKSLDWNSQRQVMRPAVQHEDETEKSNNAGAIILAFLAGMLTMLLLAIMTFSIELNL
jgi:hypothetical protein